MVVQPNSKLFKRENKKRGDENRIKMGKRDKEIEENSENNAECSLAKSSTLATYKWFTRVSYNHKALC